MVDLDVAVSQFAVGGGEVERAHLAPQRDALFQDRLDLPVAQGLVPLTVEGPASEELPLACQGRPAFLGGYADDFGGCHARVQSLGGGEHLVGALCEVGHHLAGQLATLRSDPVIPGADCHDVARLAADAARRAELRVCRRAIVQRKLPEGLGQVLHPPVGWPQLTPAVFDNERAGQQQLVTRPVDFRHSDIVRAFEIAMLLVTKVGQRMPHTGVCRRVESQCQWVMSPSVMAAV